VTCCAGERLHRFRKRLVKTDHILFHFWRVPDCRNRLTLIPELYKVVCQSAFETQALTTSDFERILTEPDASITVQFKH